MNDASSLFLHESRALLRDALLPRIRAAVGMMSDEDVWWRPNEASNSVGNLVVHLTGNVRQWIVSGIGGAPDGRERQAEFDRREPLPTAEILARLAAAVADADAVLDRLALSALLEHRTIQGRDVSVLEAIYHVVEHFSMHAGQIIYVAKLRTGRDAGFYELVDGIPRERWSGAKED